MTDLSSLLNQPEFVHAALNHFPLTGLFIAVLGLAIALATRNRTGVLAGLALVTLLALSVWPVSYFGNAGYDRVLSMSDEAGQAFLRRHEDLAERWEWLFYVTAGVGAVGFGTSWKWPRILTPAAILAVVLALASLGAGIVIAHNGGEIRHREFRRGLPPAVQQEKEQS
jgi:hypothetical protein